MATLEMPRLQRRWHRQCRQLQHPDIELTVEEFSALLSTYKLLRSEGHPFDPAVVALMTVLERQARDTDDNTDRDGGDDDSIGNRCGVM